MKKQNSVVLIVIAVVFSVVFLPVQIEWIHGKNKFDENFSNFTRGNIQQIDVSSDFNSATILKINERRACDEFYDAVTTQESYSPNHPHYEMKYAFTITLKTGKPLQMTVATMKDQDYAYCHYVSYNGFGTDYYSSFKSRDLYLWLNHNKFSEPSN